MSLRSDLWNGRIPRELVQNWCNTRHDKCLIRDLLIAERFRPWAWVPPVVMLLAFIATVILNHELASWQQVVSVIGTIVLLLGTVIVQMAMFSGRFGQLQAFELDTRDLVTILNINTAQWPSMHGLQESADSRLIAICGFIKTTERLMDEAHERKDKDQLGELAIARKDQKEDLEGILELYTRFGLERHPSFYYDRA